MQPLRTPKPIVTALNGSVAGGVLTSVLLTDIVIAERHVRLRDVHVNAGLVAATSAMLWPMSAGILRANGGCSPVTGSTRRKPSDRAGDRSGRHRDVARPRRRLRAASRRPPSRDALAHEASHQQLADQPHPGRLQSHVRGRSHAVPEGDLMLTVDTVSVKYRKCASALPRVARRARGLGRGGARRQRSGEEHPRPCGVRPRPVHRRDRHLRRRRHHRVAAAQDPARRARLHPRRAWDLPGLDRSREHPHGAPERGHGTLAACRDGAGRRPLPAARRSRRPTRRHPVRRRTTDAGPRPPLAVPPVW